MAGGEARTVAFAREHRAPTYHYLTDNGWLDHGGFGEEVIADAFLVTQEGWHDALTKFCALIGVPPELVRPRWTLTLRG